MSRAQDRLAQAPTVVRHLGLVPYEATWRRMQSFTDERGPDTPDEIWCLEHPPVFTLGMNADPTHVLAPGDIPLVETDRGGQVTYHGPGQLVMYPLLDLERRGLGVRRLVAGLEEAVVRCLGDYEVQAYPLREAPGVYVEGRKVASLGLRVRRNCSYHGLAFNVDMDLEPFSRINPCGFQGLELTQLKDLGVDTDVAEVADRLLGHVADVLGLDLAPGAQSSP